MRQLQVRPSCCAAGREIVSDKTVRDTKELPSPTNAAKSREHIRAKMVRLAGGTFRMGTDAAESFPEDGEGPPRWVTLKPFLISPHAVTNHEFSQFVEQTGYRTEAERFGWSFVFHMLVSQETRRKVTQFPPQTPWWLVVHGANWLHPEGPDSSLANRSDHPVVHISWNDAAAYCLWAGVRLPTEAEWEFAARGGLAEATYPWGNELTPGGEHRCNIWQGEFPIENRADDGYISTAPVQAYQPNGYGLFNMVGNVWEWCADWFSADYHRITSIESPYGSEPTGSRSIRGGSYLCHDSYCNRYRTAARSKNTPDSSTGNMGFRIAASV